MRSPFVLAEKALGTPNFASRGHQTGVWHPNPAPPIYPTLPLPATRRCDSRPLTSPEPRRPGTARRKPVEKKCRQPSRASRRALWRSKGRGPARRLPPHTRHCRRHSSHMRLPPAHLTRAPPPRHGPTKARREEVQAAIESLPASSWALKRSRTRPSLAAPLPAFAGDGITNLVLSSVFPPPPLSVGRPTLAG